MKQTFTVEQKSLLSILSSMQPICSKRTTLDATTSILFSVGARELVLRGTDLEISLQTIYPLLQSSLIDQRTFLVNGKRLFDVVKELEGTIVFTLENNQISLESHGITLALNIKDAQEFPPFPERIENLMQIESRFLLELLDKVGFLIPQNNGNPALNGLLLEIDQHNFTMTTTDGHCLAQIKTNKYSLEAPRSWLLPRRAVLELRKILEESKDEQVFLGTCGNQLVFSGEMFNFFTKLLASQFPEYRPILQKQGFIPAVVDKSNLVKTLRRSACLLSGQFIATSFGFTPTNIDVVMHNKEVGKLEEKLPIQKFEGEDISMRFYAPYLLSGLNAFSDEAITFYLHNASKPIIFESNHSDKYQLTYLVMPVSPTTSHAS